MDSADAIIAPLSGDCSVAMSSSSALPGSTPGHLILPTGSVDTLVGVSVTLDNTSVVDQAISATGLVDCNTQQPVTLTTSVAANASGTLDACALVSCAGPPPTVTAVGSAVATGDYTCVNDDTGVPVTITRTCAGEVSCVAPFADLSINKAVVSGQAKPGQLLIYTIGVMNAGPLTAKDVVVNDPVPQGTTFYAASPAPSSAPPKGAAGTVVWSEGDLANGGGDLLTVAVMVGARGNTQIVNTATVTSSTPDSNLANNTATITTRRRAR